MNSTLHPTYILLNQVRANNPQLSLEALDYIIHVANGYNRGAYKLTDPIYDYYSFGVRNVRDLFSKFNIVLRGNTEELLDKIVAAVADEYGDIQID